MKKLKLFIVILFFYACNNSKKEPLILNEEPQTLIKNSNKNEDPIIGIYTAIIDSDNGNDCKLTIELVKTKGNYTIYDCKIA